MNRGMLILILALAATVFGEQLSTVATTTKTEVKEEPGFFAAAFTYLEMGLKRIFGFKGEESRDNSTSTAAGSELIRVLSKSTDRAEQLLAGGSKAPVNSTTVPPVAGVIVVKEDHTTQKKH